MKILFITSTRVGDAVLSTGVLDHLITKYPGARITIACGPAAASLFTAVPGLERIIVLDKMLLSLHWLKMWSRCVGCYWDMVVDLRKAPLSYLLLAQRQHHMRRTREPGHRVVQLSRVLGLGQAPPAPKLWTSNEHLRRAMAMIPEGAPVLAIGPTANWRAKTWPSECFSELCARMTAADGMLAGARVAVFGRADERPHVLVLIESIPKDRRIDLVGQADLLEIYSCLNRCAFYVGNDSGLMHLAAASGVPTLGLFGPSAEENYAPWGPLCEVVRANKSFQDIFPARFDHRASGSLMKSLSVDQVETAARMLWQRVAEATA